MILTLLLAGAKFFGSKFTNSRNRDIIHKMADKEVEGRLGGSIIYAGVEFFVGVYTNAVKLK